nr:immunity 52 family protein [Hyalangium versicolor]
MAVAWEPDWAVATSDSLVEMSTKRPSAGTFVGWVMYFSRRRGPVPPLPEPVRVEPVEGLGTLVTLTQERFTVSNPVHVELASRVSPLLDQAGLLSPVVSRPPAPPK